MSSIKVLLYSSKVLKNGESPIMIRFIKDRKTKYLSVGHSCHPDLWDFNKDKPKRKHPNFRELEINIEKKRTEANAMLLTLENEKTDFSLDELEQKIRVNAKKMSVIAYLDQTIIDLNNAGRVGYAVSHKDLKRVLMKFRQNKDFNFVDIDQTFLRKFEQDFEVQGINKNSMGVYFRTLRALYNKAIKEGYAKKASYPFDDFKVSKLKNTTQKRAIPKDEVLKIKALDIVEGSRLYNTRNFFLFSFYCSGMNFVDVAKLEWSNIHTKNDIVLLSYVRSKTKKQFNFQLLQPAIEILNYYRTFRLENFVFPYLDKNKHNTPISIDNRLKKAKKQVNEDLKEIAKLAGIETNLTTYVARHTFATAMKRSGVSTSIISEMMGHESETITQVYLDSFENEQIYEAAKNLL